MKDTSDKLIAIFELLKELKNKNVKMKDIAEVVNFPPSVLSALFSTVLPTYVKALSSSSHEEALDFAISQVNNVSRKRLTTNLDNVYDDLQALTATHVSENINVPFLARLSKEATHSNSISGKIDGIYISYSQSSASVKQMKLEPFLIKSSEDGRHIFVTRKNTSGSYHEGFAILKEHQALHVLFNESNDPNFYAPVSIMFQLPFVEDYDMLKGLYLCLDVAKNPIARRIVLKRISSSVSYEDFEQTPSSLVSTEDLCDEQKLFADYACQMSDAIKMYSIPSRGCDIEDLAKEKAILSICNS